MTGKAMVSMKVVMIRSKSTCAATDKSEMAQPTKSDAVVSSIPSISVSEVQLRSIAVRSESALCHACAGKADLRPREKFCHANFKSTCLSII
jgi:hypothetical protein